MVALSERISKLNQKGRQNLNEQGVALPLNSKTSTIIDSILDIVGSKGIYKSVEFVDNNTIELLDADNVFHELKLIFTNDILSDVVYDSKSIAIQYNEETGDVSSVGNTAVNLRNFQAKEITPNYTSITSDTDNNVTFLDNNGNARTMGCTYEEGKITSLDYDSTLIDITYNDKGELTKIGDTTINLEQLMSNMVSENLDI